MVTCQGVLTMLFGAVRCAVDWELFYATEFITALIMIV